MGKLIAIRAQNLRSLEDTGFIEFRPITVLVGRNSAGKSTFARILPLLRQTAEVRKREPILWWGRFVDFGSFGDSISRDCTEKEIEFSFKVLLDIHIRETGPITWSTAEHPPGTTKTAEASLVLVEGQKKHEAALSRICIKEERNQYKIHFGQDQSIEKIIVNEYIWAPPAHTIQKIYFNTIFPEINFFRTRKIRTSDGKTANIQYRDDPLTAELTSFFYHRKLVHSNTSWDTIWDICRQIDTRTTNSAFKSIKSIVGAPPSWYRTTQNIEAKDPRVDELRNRILASKVISLIEQIDEVVTNSASNCSYIEPLRATAERYYRKQGLAVAEVDSKGANVPFFLESLTPTDRERFNAWMQRYLEANVQTSSDGGHLSIRIKDKTGLEANLADVGFGFSQVLPVALQLWASTRRVRGKSIRNTIEAIVVIEQPELHLHPDYQAKIADLLKSAIEAGDTTTIVETHSASLINRLGILIATGELEPSDVQILRFDKTEDQASTTVSKSEFDEDGVLRNWPFGFFDG